MPKVERLASTLRTAAERIERALSISPDEFNAVWGPRVGGLGFAQPETREEASSRAAWCLVGVWLLARTREGIAPDEGVDAALNWFFGGRPRPTVVTASEPALLGPDVAAGTIHALLPYLLDPSAPATRRDLLRGRVAPEMRASRKASGVYFTPGDVAHFMVTGTLADGFVGKRWLDPAVGSGVFLRAITSTVPDADVYGIDVEPVAAEMASFVLAAERDSDPWVDWHRCRANLATADALMVVRGPADGRCAAGRGRVLTALERGEDTGPVVDGGPLGRSETVSLAAIFPALAKGADALIQNPPYAAPGLSRVAQLSQRWGSAPSNIYPLFIRLGVDLIGSTGRMAAVVPSSIVCSSARHVLDARHALHRASGDLEILNYDRAPDGLFGDDIKTRTSVLFLDSASQTRRLRVGPMTRLTSHTRNGHLQRGRAIELPPSALTLPLVPKLESPEQVPLLSAIQRATVPLGSMVRMVKSRPLGSPDADPFAIILGPTAYNWLNVQRQPSASLAMGHDSSSGYWHLSPEDGNTGDAVYAILSSRVAFWVWHAYGDGFHVGRWLLTMLPGVERFEDTDMLAKLGRELWHRVQATPVVSVNGGRRSVAFPGTAEAELVDEIDALVLANLELSERSVNLRAWMRDLAIAGRGTSDDEPMESVGQA